jgi:Zn-dependent protease with chaperone function
MPQAPIHITPRRSATFFALLAVAMVILSYALILFIAAASAYLPYLVISAIEHPNAQLLALFLSGLVIAGTIVFSIFPRRDKFVALGPLLERSAHPLLFAELDRVAAALQETLPREVYLIGDVNAFVQDRGGIMGFGSRRVLGVGLPLLAILNVSEFRGVLAHEFAHYYGGDTKLGPWVYKTHMAVARAFENIRSIGRSVGLPWVFRLMQSAVTYVLSWYFVFFLRVIKFISRKAEFRADELACFVAGSAPMMQGLRLTHGAGYLWSAYWTSEVSPVVRFGSIPPIGEGFARFLKVPQMAATLDAIIETAIAEEETDPYDSHPPLKERLAAVQRLSIPAMSADAEPAISLLADPAATEQLFVETVNPNIPKATLRHMPWSQVSQQVTLPSWRAAVSDYLGLLSTLTIGNLPEALADLPKLSSKIKDPKGMLLAPDDRVERASQILAMALGLRLVESGWELKDEPGICLLQQGNEQVNVFAVMQDLRSGTLTPDAWKARALDLGVAELSLGLAAPQQASAGS